MCFSAVLDFVRKVQWGYALGQDLPASHSRFGFVASSAWPPRGLVPLRIQALSRRILSAARAVLFDDHCCYQTQNLTTEEYSLLRSLSADRDVIIKPADKGGRWVVMDRSEYSRECERLLSDPAFYLRLNNPPDSVTVKCFAILERLLSARLINKREFRFLISPSSPKERLFKALPKVHKRLWPSLNMAPARPIIADVSSETSNVARLVDHFLFPLARRLPSFLLDSSHLIALLRERRLSSGSLLCSLDVRSLYTNVPIEEGIRRVAAAFRSHPDSSRPDNEVLELLRICLVHNDFVFDGQRFRQVSGVQMGKAFGGSFANLYMGHWESTALASSVLRPDMWLRYQDDIFCARFSSPVSFSCH